MTTEEKILLRSRMLFMEKGISGTQMTEIAESVGINRRTLYRYFPTKEHLVCHLQVRISNQLNDYLNRLASRLKAPKGTPRIKEYFQLIDLEKLHDLFYLLAQFDSHFAGDYPTEDLRREMELLQSPQNKGLYRVIIEGQNSGTIRRDIPPEQVYQYLSQSYLALTNHIILKRSHFGKKWEENTDFFHLHLESVLKEFTL